MGRPCLRFILKNSANLEAGPRRPGSALILLYLRTSAGTLSPGNANETPEVMQSSGNLYRRKKMQLPTSIVALRPLSRMVTPLPPRSRSDMRTVHFDASHSSALNSDVRAPMRASSMTRSSSLEGPTSSMYACTGVLPSSDLKSHSAASIVACSSISVLNLILPILPTTPAAAAAFSMAPSKNVESRSLLLRSAPFLLYLS